MGDGAIATAIVEGALGAVGIAFDRHGQELYNYCQSQLSDKADAAQVVEATFVIAAAKASLLRSPARLRAWLFAIAHCGCQQRLEAGAKPAYLDELAADYDWDRLGGSPWRSDVLAAAWRTLPGMNPRDREVVELSLRHGLDTGELANVLGVPPSQARTLARNSRAQFGAATDLLLAACRDRPWYCEAAVGYLATLDSDLTRVSPRWMSGHAARCGICGKREQRKLDPALILGLLPTVTLQADERLRLLWVLSDHSAEVEAYRAEVIMRMGSFGPDGFPGRSGPRAIRRRGTYVVAAGAAALAVALLGFGAVLVDEHTSAQGGSQPAARAHRSSAPAHSVKAHHAGDSHSSSRQIGLSPPDPVTGANNNVSPAPTHSTRSPSPKPSRSAEPSSKPSPSHSPSPATTRPTPTPTLPKGTPSVSASPSAA